MQSRSGNFNVEKEDLTKALIKFLVEDQHTSANYIELISEFILINEQNEKIQEGLNRIREGSILYLGINHNIAETGSITKSLTLYLGTEILFSLAGYNGEIYKQLAEDFYNIVRSANSNGRKMIVLRYFEDTKKEIEEFFSTAEGIVEGKTKQWLDKPAMTAIINGCSTASDVMVKKSDFYSNMKISYGIVEDPNHNYYGETLFRSNLESDEYIDDEDKNKKKEYAIKLISHINKLRNGKRYTNDLESEYLLVTNAKVTLLISQEQINKIKSDEGLESVANLAVSLDRITSLLWYKLVNGFGKKDFPANVSAVLRARVVLSSNIAKNADKTYFDIKKQFENGIITDEQLAARIITLKNKPTLPEELQGDDIEEIMDFSQDFLRRYEEKVKLDQKSLKEKEELIKKIKDESDAKDKTILDKDYTIKQQFDELEKYRSQESENI